MNIRQTFRENWDTAFIVVAVGLILGWALFIFCLSPLLAQTDPRMLVTCSPITDPRLANYRIETTVGVLPFAVARECSRAEMASGCPITGIEGSITYKVRVAGIDTSRQVGLFSDPVSFNFNQVQPTSPTNLAQSSASSTTPGRVARRFTWSAVKYMRNGSAIATGLTVSYRLYMATSDPSTTGVIGSVVATVTTTDYTYQGMQKNRSFYFWVTCIAGGIESFGSPAVRVQT
jgi:hypothetical protein